MSKTEDAADYYDDPEDGPIVEGSAFDKEFFQPVLIIQLNRIYDALMAILSTQGESGPGMAAHLHALHETGRFLSPPPAFQGDDVTEE